MIYLNGHLSGTPHPPFQFQYILKSCLIHSKIIYKNRILWLVCLSRLNTVIRFKLQILCTRQFIRIAYFRAGLKEHLNKSKTCNTDWTGCLCTFIFLTKEGEPILDEKVLKQLSITNLVFRFFSRPENKGFAVLVINTAANIPCIIYSNLHTMQFGQFSRLTDNVDIYIYYENVHKLLVCHVLLNNSKTWIYFWKH